MLQPKQLIIIGGANGSGKTTFALPYIKDLGYDFLNADEIAKEFEDIGSENPMIKAGRIFFSRLDEYIVAEKNFVVETTLSGTYINKVATRAKVMGYEIKVIYIFLDSANLCIERVKSRVLKGGHDVPEADIERRFYRSKSNFWNNFIHIADSWVLLYKARKGFNKWPLANLKNFGLRMTIYFKNF